MTNFILKRSYFFLCSNIEDFNFWSTFLRGKWSNLVFPNEHDGIISRYSGDTDDFPFMLVVESTGWNSCDHHDIICGRYPNREDITEESVKTVLGGMETRVHPIGGAWWDEGTGSYFSDNTSLLKAAVKRKVRISSINAIVPPSDKSTKEKQIKLSMMDEYRQKLDKL